jgi:putative YphP/YqiW family bacilliredoxin
MRRELTELGVEEMLNPAQVDEAMRSVSEGTALVIVNSVCGCAAANARPAVRLAMQSPIQPDRFLTVFAGQDLEATAQMRSYLVGIPPSSPFIALMKDGQPVFILERRNIEGRTASAIAYDLVQAYQTYCSNGQSGDGRGLDHQASHQAPDAPDSVEAPEERGTFRSIL